MGITPAYAGKSSQSVFNSLLYTGSPPRMRGKVGLFVCGLGFGRITPSYAGKRTCGKAHRSAPWDHPRVCGEKYGKFIRINESTGITPAYAGKSPVRFALDCFPEDHPRVCGEKLFGVWRKSLSSGSPPRMRGKAAVDDAAAHDHRITPAYAGKSGQRTVTLQPAGDHPRVCGEKVPAPMVMTTGAGSPPRMRGKVHAGRLHGSLPGITPAYAGKSGRMGAFLASRRDHPRVCGEKPPPHSVRLR